MSLAYPNIVPANNLRLPDALTIKHGPARLLADFILEGDKAARRKGLQLRIRHDYEELVAFNKRRVAIGDWYPLVDAYNPQVAEMTPENAFWVSGEDEFGEIAITGAWRIYNWVGTNLAEQARALWYGRDLGQPCVVTAEAAKLISGITIFGGAAWIRPDFRGKHLSRLIPRITRAYACSRWPIDWTFCYISRSHVEKGLAVNYGHKNLSYSIVYPGSPRGEQVLAYTPVAEFYDDLANFLMTELSENGPVASDKISESTGLEHIVTNTSSDGVLHGSINLS